MFYLEVLGSIFLGILHFIYVASCIFLILVVMVRQGETGGLSTAFGGAGEVALGAKAQKTIDKVIIWAAGIFVVFSILLNLRFIVNLGSAF